MKNNIVDKRNLEKLSYELTYHKYLMNKDKVHHLFTDITVAEYITLHDIVRLAPEGDAEGVKTYLTDLTGVLKLPIHGVSKLVSELNEKGLVLWSHDGNGSEGTYVTITGRGLKLMEHQEEKLRKYYGAVIEKFGKDNMYMLLKMVEELEDVVEDVFTEIGEELYGNQTD
ncbi:MAG: MarR family transcriptional regulator [Bacillota bacterium]|nr:MarR family transcriptional regulator [Bacillota bacterium]